MSRWFRHYAGMMRDEKLVGTAVRSKQPVERVVWVWGAILESAAEINDAGRYEFDAGEAAYFLRCDENELVRIIECLDDIGRISRGVVVRWSERQFDSDSAKERQRRYRERLKARGDVQELHDDVGKTSSDVTRDGYVTSRDGVVTLQEAETDTDKKQEPTGSSKKRGARLPDDFSPDMAAAVEAGLSQAEAQREALKFRDYWISQPGQKGVKLDWLATWRNWCRHAVERRPQQRSGSPPLETVASFSRKQLLEQRQNDDTDNSSGRVVQIDARRLENSPSGTRTFAVSGNLLGSF